MRITFADHQVMVIDDFIDPSSFEAVSRYTQAIRYPGKMRLIGYDVKYSLRAGIHLTQQGMSEAPELAREMASRRVVSALPTGDAADLVTDRFATIADMIRDTVGAPDEQWLGYTRDVFCSKGGAGLRWHCDADTYCGAYVFYASSNWDADWGGELCLKPIPNVDLRQMSRHDKVKELDAGCFFFPRPNRLILLRGGTPHKVTPVDAKAGMPRYTITGFFLNQKGLKQKERQLREGYRNAPLWRKLAVDAAMSLYGR